MRLVCFPHAGAGASSFFAWGQALPPEIEVCSALMPGRESRIAEVPFTRMAPLVERLATALEPWLDRECAFFGHSLGALVAFELARELARRGLPLPRRLFLSGRRAPTLPLEGDLLHPLPDEELVEQIRVRYGGIPREILNEPELVRYFLPVIRADVELFETYTCEPGPPLACPFSLYNGRDDHQVSETGVEAWRQLTSAGFEARRFPGGHFYLHEYRQEVLTALAADLQLPTGR
ncbi:MAG: thioesterase II family protein [Armatimonadota bacterium]